MTELIIYNGPFEKIVDSEVISPLSETVLFYTITNSSEVGFSRVTEGLKFIQKFVANAFTVLYPRLEIIENSGDIEKALYRFRGVTVFSDETLTSRAVRELSEYDRVQKKNILLARYGKTTETVDEPFFLNWYDERRYTDKFIEFVTNRKLPFVVWQYSEFGTTFFHFDDGSPLIPDIVQLISDDLEIQVREINKTDQLPYH